MQVYVMALDSTATLPDDCYYIWYKGLYLKYNKTINNHTKEQSLSHTDSFLTISEGKKEDDIWRTMAEFARAWGYANDLQIRTTPTMISSPASLRNIKKYINRCGDLRTLAIQTRFMRGTEFVRITHIDTEEKAKLLSIYTAANANPNVCFKILFFWHVLVCPSKNDQIAIECINNNFNKIDLPNEYREVICDGTFGKIENNNVGYYIKTKIRHPIAHIVMNSGVNIDLDSKKQHLHLWAIAEMLKEIAKYKLDNDYNFKEDAPFEVCHLFNPDEEVFTYQ